MWIENNLISTNAEASVRSKEVLLQIDRYYGSESNKASADLFKQFGQAVWVKEGEEKKWYCKKYGGKQLTLVWRNSWDVTQIHQNSRVIRFAAYKITTSTFFLVCMFLSLARQNFKFIVCCKVYAPTVEHDIQYKIEFKIHKCNFKSWEQVITRQNPNSVTCSYSKNVNSTYIKRLLLRQPFFLMVFCQWKDPESVLVCKIKLKWKNFFSICCNCWKQKRGWRKNKHGEEQSEVKDHLQQSRKGKSAFSEG